MMTTITSSRPKDAGSLARALLSIAGKSRSGSRPRLRIESPLIKRLQTMDDRPSIKKTVTQ